VYEVLELYDQGLSMSTTLYTLFATKPKTNMLGQTLRISMSNLVFLGKSTKKT